MPSEPCGSRRGPVRKRPTSKAVQLGDGDDDGGRHYLTTIEVRNGSDLAQTVTVTVDADLGRGGVSDAFEVPAGASDAWAVTSDEETTDEVGDVECADYINGIQVTLAPAEG
jgi:hypothetical protein